MGQEPQNKLMPHVGSIALGMLLGPVTSLLCGCTCCYLDGDHTVFPADLHMVEVPISQVLEIEAENIGTFVYIQLVPDL
jgi:hypothetical protein